MRDRAYRRFTLRKRKQQVKKYMANHWHSSELACNMKAVGRNARVRGICSCRMCGNPRKWWHELTQQEKVQDQKDKEDV